MDVAALFHRDERDGVIASLRPDGLPNLCDAWFQGGLNPLAGHPHDSGVIDAAHASEATQGQISGAVCEDAHANTVDLAFSCDFEVEHQLRWVGDGSWWFHCIV